MDTKEMVQEHQELVIQRLCKRVAELEDNFCTLLKVLGYEEVDDLVFIDEDDDEKA